eukprot:scaffold8455_cov104-Isochrysis_galbana.AAC.7
MQLHHVLVVQLAHHVQLAQQQVALVLVDVLAHQFRRVQLARLTLGHHPHLCEPAFPDGLPVLRRTQSPASSRSRPRGGTSRAAAAAAVIWGEPPESSSDAMVVTTRNR